MRTFLPMFALAALAPLAYGQRPAPHEKLRPIPFEPAPLVRDTRPFGKYLVGICAFDSPDMSVACTPPAQAIIPKKIPQTIELKQVSKPGAQPGASPDYPLAINSDWFVSAQASSGLPVELEVLAGAARRVTPAAAPPAGTVQFHVDGPGVVVLKGSQKGDAAYATAWPVTLQFDVGSVLGSPCKLFPLSSGARGVQQIDSAGMIPLLGAPVPFVLTAQSKNVIFVYSTRSPRPGEVEPFLRNLKGQIQALLGRTTDSLGAAPPKPFSVELQIPHAPALGDLAARMSGLGYSQLTIQNAGSDSLRVSAPAQPECDVWTAFLTDVRRVASQISPEPYNSRLFYADAKAVADAFTAAAPPAPGGGANGAGTPAASGAGAGGGGAPASGAAPGGAPANASISINQPPGSFLEIRSDTTPCVIAGLTLSNSSACSPAGASPAPAGGSPGAPGGGSPAPAPKPVVGMASLDPDVLMFSNSVPGDDAQVEERRRLIAQLDLPRPEMIINAWVMQNSSTSPTAMGAFSSVVRDVVNQHNEKLENLVLNGWIYLKTRIAAGHYFDDAFYHYLSDRYFAERPSEQPPAKDPQAAAQAFLQGGHAHMIFPPGATAGDFGICDAGRYCLGYVNLFQPLKPRLTNLLLALIAAKDPMKTTRDALMYAEGPRPPPGLDQSFCDTPVIDEHEHCRTVWKNLDLSFEAGSGEESCETADMTAVVWSAFSPPVPDYGRTRVYLRCFEKAAHKFMTEAQSDLAASSPSGIGLLRAAVANFLFNYKLSQEYPHEFSPYELSQSADALNSALGPLMEAFNRDVAAFQRFVRADVLYRVERLNREHDQRCCVKRLFGLDKPSFFNDGIITVRTISGQWTYVNSLSQSFLNLSSAPTLSSLFNSVAGAGPAAPASAGPPLLSALAGKSALGSAQLAAGALNAYQTSYAQIGRALAISAIPRSLATASSAEVVVTLNADESSKPPTYSSGPQSGTEVNLSRVAAHDTSTRVRVDSVKLFEISSFSAVLQRSRSRFPLIPPFVELPYIGTIAGIPLPPAKEYHQSTAILSAIVVPTAADLAYGLRYLPDILVEGDKETCTYLKSAPGERCRFEKVRSLDDFQNSLTKFNGAMVQCLATDLRSAYSSINGFTPVTANTCAALSFDGMPQ